MFRFQLLLSVLCFGLSISNVANAQDANDTNRKKATEAEKNAFSHIENKDWCQATNAFLDAYEYVPEVLYIYNAAKAAEFAQDRKLALQLSLEMMGKFPSSDKQTEINNLIQKLSGELTSSGPGTACPRTIKKTESEAAKNQAPTVAQAPTPQTETTPPVAPVRPEEPSVNTSQPPTTAKQNEGFFAPQNAGLFIGVGAGVSVVGALTLGVSGLSYTEMAVLSAQHETEKQRLLENPSDESLLQSTRDLEAMFIDEQSTYQMSLISGAAITTVGALTLGFGLYLNAQQPAEE